MALRATISIAWMTAVVIASAAEMTVILVVGLLASISVAPVNAEQIFVVEN